MKETYENPTNSINSINRDSYEPVYIQLANILQKLISEGVYRIGDQLPSEAQLVEQYKVSPMTVRRSINILADQGVVSTAQGRGTFVKPLELTTATFNMRDLQDYFRDDSNTDVKLLDVRIIPADERTSRKLDLEIGTNTIYIRRLITEEGKPIFYHRAHLVYDPLRPIVEAEMDVTSLQGLFTTVDNTMLQWGKLTITSTLLNETEAQILDTVIPSPAFNIEHLFFDINNQPISWGWLICRSDTLRFTTTVGISRH
jgi:GntR family transcriptional regulator